MTAGTALPPRERHDKLGPQTILVCSAEHLHQLGVVLGIQHLARLAPLCQVRVLAPGRVVYEEAPRVVGVAGGKVLSFQTSLVHSLRPHPRKTLVELEGASALGELQPRPDGFALGRLLAC
eukprot:514608-Hanusia_phi.AAC.2